MVVPACSEVGCYARRFISRICSPSPTIPDSDSRHVHCLPKPADRLRVGRATRPHPVVHRVALAHGQRAGLCAVVWHRAVPRCLAGCGAVSRARCSVDGAQHLARAPVGGGWAGGVFDAVTQRAAGLSGVALQPQGHGAGTGRVGAAGGHGAVPTTGGGCRARARRTAALPRGRHPDAQPAAGLGRALGPADRGHHGVWASRPPARASR